MSFYNYSQEFEAIKSARAQGYDLDASYKDLVNVCAAIRGREYKQAVQALEEAIALRKPIRYRKHAKGVGHRPQLRGAKGRFPRKECKLVLSLLKNAFANAQAKGLSEDALVVLSARAYKQNVFPRYRRYFVGGRSIGFGKYAVFSNYSTARVELVLGERSAQRVKRKMKKQKKLELLKAREKGKAQEQNKVGEKQEQKPGGQQSQQAEVVEK